MDLIERVNLAERAPTEEIVTRGELLELFRTKEHPRHYIGLEISGFLHLGSLLTTGFKINDLIKAGVRCTVFLADWHTVINDKLGGDWESVSRVSKYYADAFRTVCPGVDIVMGSDLYSERREYWAEIVRFSKHITLARTVRALTILGRTESESNDLAKLLYPPMQAVDMHFLEVDIAHSGMDQRKIHMLAREVFPKMGWDVPVAVHHRLLPGLRREGGGAEKMSKSDPDSGILVHDSDDAIRSKISKAWCEAGMTDGNPLLAICQNIIFHEFDEMIIERPAKFGGNASFGSFDSLASEFGSGAIHPADLKQAVSSYLVKILSPLRDRLTPSDELRSIITRTA